MKPSLCLNMIVKNEAARIERCLRSVLPYVKAVYLHDTGSTDNTPGIAWELADAAGVPIHISNGPFENFSQARNDAFAIAQNVNGSGALPWCQFALLMDADMELVVDDPHAFDVMVASAASYDMMQKGGTVSYMNRRIVNLDACTPPYVGVTHEYIDLGAAALITGAWFRDHADGSNRVNKYERDIALLKQGVIDEPTNRRYWYYLGNSYRDGNQPEEAIAAYTKCIEMGGWDEETHSAMMNRACCWKDTGNLPGFLTGMVEAYNFRPSRAEPLYDLAKHYREKGDHAASLLFSKAGVNIKRPNDVLFVNDFVYSHGLRYEYSIEGYYDEAERNRAFQVTDDLALDPTCPSDIRWSARSNLYWHTKPLRAYCSSFSDRRVHIALPKGYTGMNPSVEVCGDRIYCNIRAVNYRMDEQGRYMIGEKDCNDAPIDTRNFLCTMTDDFSVQKIREIIWHRPQAVFPQVTGLEDIRLWRFHGQQYFSATVREQNYGGLCQMVQGKLTYDIDDQFMLVEDWKVISDGDQHQKNWMPMPAEGGNPRYMYRLDTVVIPEGLKRVAEVMPTKVHVSDISGSSQVIPFKSGLLAVVHEASTDPQGKRTYWHRFAWFEKDGYLRRLSLPFVFNDRQIEFCAGLAYHPNNKDLIISYGVRDAEAHLATVSIEEVAMMCWKFHEN
jgi:glycosyltransferase involved in cell wall biosynthesis